MFNLFYGNWDYWELRDKVTFDYYNLLIIVNEEVTELNIKEDVYSAWKRWMLVDQNAGRALPALRTVGGDPTISGQFAGDIYFTINGWRIQFDPNKTALLGTIFSDDFASPLVDKNGNLIQQSLVSSLVTGVVTRENVVTGDISSVPTQVRTELTPELTEISETRQRIEDVPADVRTELTPELTDITETRQKVDDIPGDIFDTPKSTASQTPGSIGEYIGKKLLDFQRWFSQK